MANNLHIPIFLASDDNYAKFLNISMLSILYNTNSFIDFYILDDNIVNFHKEQIIKSLNKNFSNFTIQFISINVNEYFKNMNITPNYPTLNIYSRFLISDLKKEINKAIYIDCDTIILDDISKLYYEKLNPYIIGAVPEHPYNMDLINLRNNIQSSKNHLYFNSGVLLIDCKKWREKNITKSILKIKLNKYLCPDQDLLNKYFDNDYKVLSYKYNLKSGDIYYNEKFKKENKNEFVISEIEKIKNNPIIKHFNSPDRAWQKNKSFEETKIKFFEDFWFFAKMTPFYEGMLNNFNDNLSNTVINKIINSKVKILKLFNLIPFIKIKTKLNKKYFYLFNFIPLLTIKEKK